MPPPLFSLQRHLSCVRRALRDVPAVSARVPRDRAVRASRAAGGGAAVAGGGGRTAGVGALDRHADGEPHAACRAAAAAPAASVAPLEFDAAAAACRRRRARTRLRPALSSAGLATCCRF